MKDNHYNLKSTQLMNKLESIFVGYFKMVNNLILNAITKDKNGNLVVKKRSHDPERYYKFNKINHYV